LDRTTRQLHFTFIADGKNQLAIQKIAIAVIAYGLLCIQIIQYVCRYFRPSTSNWELLWVCGEATGNSKIWHIYWKVWALDSQFVY